MTMGLGIACVVFGVVCGVSAAVLSRREMSSKRTDEPKETVHVPEKTMRECERDAYYMRNFWNYDGSEQREWED